MTTPTEPEGWVLVPREPTEAQLRAVALAFGATAAELVMLALTVSDSQTARIIRDAYRAMIEAAPSLNQPPIKKA